MVKLLWLLAVAAVGWKLMTGRWPWEPRRVSGRSAEVERARALLGLREDAGHTEIIEAHRRLIALVHPDRGGTSEQVHEANAARDLLLAALAARKPEQT